MELPNVYANPINKRLNNVQELYNGHLEERNDSIPNLMQKIRNIFSSPNHIYKSRVRIKTKDGEYEKVIIGRTETNLLTMDGERIKIIDIYDINKI